SISEAVRDVERLTSCKLCGRKTTWKFSLPLTSGLKGEYYECEECHMLQSHHLDNMTSDQLHAFYDLKRYTDIDSRAAWRQYCIMNRIEQLVRFRIIRPSHGF